MEGNRGRGLGNGVVFFFFSSRRRHTRFDCDWSSDVCSSDLYPPGHEEDGAQLQKILRPRRDQCVRGGRQGEDRGARADLEVEALDRSTGQRTGDVMSNYFSAVIAACRGRDGGGGVSR